MVNCHPNNLWGLGDWYRVDTEPLDPEIKATHAVSVMLSALCGFAAELYE